jgi:hypothetical protein
MVSEESADTSMEETEGYLPDRPFRHGPLPAGLILRPARGEPLGREPQPEAEELGPAFDSSLDGRLWRRGPLREGALDHERVNALWVKRHGADE